MQAEPLFWDKLSRIQLFCKFKCVATVSSRYKLHYNLTTGQTGKVFVQPNVNGSPQFKMKTVSRFLKRASQP